MSLLKKLKEAYDAGRNLSEEEQSVLKMYRTGGINSVERRLERLEGLAYQKRFMLDRMKNSTILEKASFYAGRITPFHAYLK